MTPEELALNALGTASDLTERLCELPAVATLDWGDEAAQCLAGLATPARVCVMIVNVDPSGTILSTESTGVANSSQPSGPRPEEQAALVTLRSRADRMNHLGFRPSETGLTMGMVGPANEFTPARDWRVGGLGQLWAGLHVADLLIGMSQLGGVEPGRMLFTQIALSSPDARVQAHHVALLGAVMPVLVRRALLAVGPRKSTSARWLTQREQQVLAELTLGKSVRQIAEEIGRSPHTVHDHVKSLHRKLNASSRGELVARALGYIDEGRRVRDDTRVVEQKAPMSDMRPSTAEPEYDAPVPQVVMPSYDFQQARAARGA